MTAYHDHGYIWHDADVDFGSYDVDEVSCTVTFHGTAHAYADGGFTAPVDFDLCIDVDDPCAPYIVFYGTGLDRAGLAMVEEKAEAALLSLLLPSDEARRDLTASLDGFFGPELVGSGSYERLWFASGAAIFADSTGCEGDDFRLLYFRRFDDEMPLVISDPISSWLGGPAALREATDGDRIPAETLAAFQRWVEAHPDITGYKAA